MDEKPLELDYAPLIGTDDATIDDKGRILVVKKKRERLGPDFTIALGPVGCLCAYPKRVWQKKLAEILLSGPSIDQSREQFSRLFLGMAEDELNFDSQGRVVIPQKLRDLANLKKEVKLVGCGERLEIWDLKEWNAYEKDPDGYGSSRRIAMETAYDRMTRKGA